MLPERLLWQAYFITLLDDRILDVHEADGYRSFNFGTGHDLILNFAEEEEQEDIYIQSSYSYIGPCAVQYMYAHTLTVLIKISSGSLVEFENVYY
jgi:hypothetical protein